MIFNIFVLLLVWSQLPADFLFEPIGFERYVMLQTESLEAVVNSSSLQNYGMRQIFERFICSEYVENYFF